MSASVAVLLGLLAVLYAVWPLLRHTEVRPLGASRSGSEDVDAETCVRAMRDWSLAAGETQAEETISAQDSPAEGIEHEQA
jgi:hypothetical protein